jgi:hypothetical protein
MASVARARAAARGAATATHAGAEAAKPRIAAHIEDVARQTRGIPVGQQWWVKSQESLTRKILEDMRAKGVSVEDAAGLVNDALRFTITYPGESLTGSVESALDRLRGQLKQQTHGLYEVVRDPGYPLAVRQRAHEELVRLSSGLEHHRRSNGSVPSRLTGDQADDVQVLQDLPAPGAGAAGRAVRVQPR